MKTREELQAERLARFLDAGDNEASSGLDEDVREALFVIRPDLAPAPRLGVDDILASVRRGPLADDVVLSATPVSIRSGEGTVVNFPGVNDEPVASGQSPPTVPGDQPALPSAPHGHPGPVRWLSARRPSRWAMLLAAAATLFIVTRPMLYDEARPPSRVDADVALLGEPEPVGRGLAEVKARPHEQAAPSPSAAPPAAKLSQRAAPIAANPEKRAAPGSHSGEAGLDGGRRAPPRSSSEAEIRQRSVARVDRRVLTEEVAEFAADDLDRSGEGAIPEVPAERSRPAEDDLTANLEELRALARPTDRDPDAWRDGLTNARLATIDEELAAAQAARQAGDPALAGELLSRFATRPPARAAQHLAAVAAADLLAGKEPGRAEAVARDALSLSLERTPERSMLLFMLGLTLEARRADRAAAEAYRSAIEVNQAR